MTLRSVLTALAFLLCCLSVQAQALYSDGLYYFQGYSQGYTRSAYTAPGYWACGNYYPGVTRYRYTAYTAPAAKVSYKDAGWRTRLLDIAATRDKLEGKLRLEAVEQQNYLQAVQALGLQGNFRLQGYGATSGGYGLEGSTYAQTTYGVQGNTQFAYKVTDFFTPVDMVALHQMSYQAAQGVQRASSEATAAFQQGVGQQGQVQARVAEILAKGHMAAQVLASLQAAPSSEVRGVTFKVTPQGNLAVEQDGSRAPEVTDSINSRLEKVIGARCASCHAGATIKGGLDLTDYLSFGPDKKQRIWQRISLEPAHPDYTARMMPRDPQDESRPGTPLSAEERRLFFLARPSGPVPQIRQPRMEGSK